MYFTCLFPPCTQETSSSTLDQKFWIVVVKSFDQMRFFPGLRLLRLKEVFEEVNRKKMSIKIWALGKKTQNKKHKL